MRSLGISLESCEKDPLREPAFLMCYTRVKVGAHTCATMVDECATINAASKTLVKVLQLPTRPHPRPYTLCWNNQEIQIHHQVKVTFSIGGYVDVVLCDVVPVHMSVCSLVLGSPWTGFLQWQRELPCSTNCFSFVVGERRWCVTCFTPQQYFDDRRRREAYVEQETKPASKSDSNLLQANDVIEKGSTTIDNHAEADDALNGLSLMSQEVQRDGTIANVKGQRCNIFKSECIIKEKVCKLIIDGGSFTNAISSDLVHALSLSTWRLSTPRYMQWMNQSGTLKITHMVRVKFSVGDYVDTVVCAVAPLTACHLLLGRPWQYDLDATHGGHSNNYSFIHKGLHHVLNSMKESDIKANVFPAMRKKKDPPMEENDATICAPILADVNSEISSNTREVDVTTNSLTSVSDTSCKDHSEISALTYASSDSEVSIEGEVAVMGNTTGNASESHCKESETAEIGVLSNFAKHDMWVGECIPIAKKIHVFSNDAREDDAIVNFPASVSKNCKGPPTVPAIISPKADQPMNDDGETIPKPRTALFQAGEDDEPVSPTNIDSILAENSSNISSKIAVQIGSFSFDVKSSNVKEGVFNKFGLVPVAVERDRKIIDATMKCEASINDPTMFDKGVFEIMSKSRTTLIQGEDDDEPMAPQIIPSATRRNKCKLSRISTINNTMGRSFMQFGSFGVRQGDMNDRVVDDININSKKTIFVGANLCKSIMEKTSIFKYGKTLG